MPDQTPMWLAVVLLYYIMLSTCGLDTDVRAARRSLEAIEYKLDHIGARR